MNKQKPSPDNIDAPKKLKKSDKNSSEKEIGGFEDHNLLEPTRYGDWDVKGRCSDF